MADLTEIPDDQLQIQMEYYLRKLQKLRGEAWEECYRKYKERRNEADRRLILKLEGTNESQNNQ